MASFMSLYTCSQFSELLLCYTVSLHQFWHYCWAPFYTPEFYQLQKTSVYIIWMIENSAQNSASYTQQLVLVTNVYQVIAWLYKSTS